MPFTLFPSMGEYPVYDDAVYDAFAGADARGRAYREAIARHAPGRVVLDIGTGRDALWAVEAARCGARHVFAIEAQPEVAVRARRTIEAAGLGDRVTLLAGLSTEQKLPIRAELCVSEIVGNIASAEGAIAALNDARARLCTPDCVWIPFRMQTWAAAVDLSAAGPLTVAAEAGPYLDRILAVTAEPRLCLGGPAADALISDRAAVESEVFDSRRPAPRPDVTAEAELAVTAPGRLTGLLLWARVAVGSHGRELDALDGTTRGWAPVHVPLPTAAVRPGDTIALGFERRTSDDAVHPDYLLRAWLRRRAEVGEPPPVVTLPDWHSRHHRRRSAIPVPGRLPAVGS